MLRYDPQAPFTDTLSWSVFDPSANGVGVDANGYHGGAFDGRYFYLVPSRNSADLLHGEVLRFHARDPPRIPDTVYGGSFF